MGQLLAQHRQIALGMALAKEHRQVGAQPGKMTAATERRGPQGTTDVADNLLYGLFYLGAGAANFETGIHAGLLIDPGSTFTQ